MTYQIWDRNEKVVVENEDVSILAGEEAQLLTDEDMADQYGEFVDYSSPLEIGEQRPYIWRREDGTEITVGYLVCE